MRTFSSLCLQVAVRAYGANFHRKSYIISENYLVPFNRYFTWDEVTFDYVCRVNNFSGSYAKALLDSEFNEKKN